MPPCALCGSDDEPRNTVLTPCAHGFCRQCFDSYVGLAGQEEVCCPADRGGGTCGAPLDQGSALTASLRVVTAKQAEAGYAEASMRLGALPAVPAGQKAELMTLELGMPVRSGGVLSREELTKKLKQYEARVGMLEEEVRGSGQTLDTTTVCEQLF